MSSRAWQSGTEGEGEGSVPSSKLRAWGMCVCVCVCVRAHMCVRVGLLASLPSLLERDSRHRVWLQQHTRRCPGEDHDLQASRGWLVEESRLEGAI